ncbi:MAG TPA: ABC transporter ATP-binding protein [Roseiflexaceae bacterium]|nr:ABC transporter ATP-binding protein [Roseiflexaceae bacterium]HMP40207.1 ABC transporter ATP-binding protein [Roseiflexaceae bacterium]
MSPRAAPADDIVIRVQDVGKMYRIYDQPQDRLKQMLFWRFGRSYGREFWALRAVSFDVRRGETVGIIGRNGSGKSTLLQIIAGTLAPTSGEVQVHGKVAALLELGSGFNPEFSGRENVFMNGAILGISQEEMAQRFEAIAAFADIGEFIDQPVKFYSSGMVVRLAFAVQAQIEPDILIVDEALAVGDFAFQHKCMSKIKSLQERGTSILLVSHDTAAIKAHCNRALMLEHGSVYAAGNADDVSVIYYHHIIEAERQAGVVLEPPPEVAELVEASHAIAPLERIDTLRPINATTRRGRGKIRFTGVRLTDAHGNESATFAFRDWLTIDMLLQADEAIDRCYPGLLIKDLYGNYLTGMTTWSLGSMMPPLRAGQRFMVRFQIQLLFRPGSYSFVINNCIDELGSDFYDWCDNVAQFVIMEGDYRRPEYGYGMFGPPTQVELLDASNYIGFSDE